MLLRLLLSYLLREAPYFNNPSKVHFLTEFARLSLQVYFVYMAARGPTNSIPNPIPADDDGYVNATPTRTFPSG